MGPTSFSLGGDCEKKDCLRIRVCCSIREGGKPGLSEGIRVYVV